VTVAGSVIAWSARAALLATLIGLFSRRRHLQCWTFIGYLAVVITCETLMSAWPAVFFTPEFWMLKQAIYDAAKVFVAIELAWRVLRAFPGAMRSAKVSGLFVLTAATGLIVTMPWEASYTSVAEWQPRIVLGTTSLFSLTAILVLWYRLPIRAWHRALIMGFSAYLLVSMVGFNVLRLNGWEVLEWFNLADALAYLGLAVWWATEAWRPEPVMVGVPLAVQRRLGLEPERA
jgi:hypothetical protein